MDCLICCASDFPPVLDCDMTDDAMTLLPPAMDFFGGGGGDPVDGPLEMDSKVDGKVGWGCGSLPS